MFDPVGTAAWFTFHLSVYVFLALPPTVQAKLWDRPDDFSISFHTDGRPTETIPGNQFLARRWGCLRPIREREGRATETVSAC